MMINVLKDIWLLFGRLFPFPTKPGLRRVGKPNRSSPVLVTSNFELTVRKVFRALQRSQIDAWLLVCPTKGINVWCASGGGHFSTDTVVSAIRASDIENLVDHRKLILPQLSAAGVNVWSLKERTGWSPRFGPVDIEDLAEFLRGDEKLIQREHRLIKFPLAQRFVMGTNLGFNSLLFLIIPFFIGSIWVPGLWWKSIPLLFLLAVLNSILVFWLPGKPGVQKGFCLGFAVSAVFLVLSKTIWAVGPWETLGWAVGMVLLSSYLGYDMASWSPLWRADIKELVTGVRRTSVKVLTERCIGCGLCVSVCPKGVFEFDEALKKSVVMYVDACEACGACVENCPKQAIENNFRSGVCSCPTCTVINAAKTIGRSSSPHTEPNGAIPVLPTSCPSCDCDCEDDPRSIVIPP